MSKFCHNCGTPATEGDRFCGVCGAKLEPSAPAPVQSAPAQPGYAQPVPVPPMPNAPEMPARKNPAVAILSVLLVASLSVTGVLLWKQKKNPPIEESSIAASTDSTNRRTEKPSGTDTTPSGFVTGLFGGGDETTSAAVSTAASMTETPAPTFTTAGTSEAVVGTVAPPPVTAVTATPQTEAPPPETPPAVQQYPEYGDLEVGMPVDFRTVCNHDRSQHTVGSLLIGDYRREDVTEEMIAFGRENGIDMNYVEKLTVEASIYFDDENAHKYGVYFKNLLFDVYSTDMFENSMVELIDSYGEKYERYDVMFNGNANVYRWDSYTMEKEETSAVWFTETWTFIVPKGYTGLMIGYKDAADEYTGYAYENYSPEVYRLFRLD